MKSPLKTGKGWIKLLIAGGMAGLMSILVLSSLPIGNVYAQQPTGNVPTVTGTPTCPHITVYSDQTFIDVYAGPSSYDYEKIGIMAAAMWLRHQHGYVAAHDFGECVSEHAFSGRIERAHGPAFVDGQHGVEGVLDDDSEIGGGFRIGALCSLFGVDQDARGCGLFRPARGARPN